MWPWMWHEACALGILDLNNEHAKEILIWKLQSISNGDETSISMHGFRGGTHRYKAPYTVSVAVCEPDGDDRVHNAEEHKDEHEHNEHELPSLGTPVGWPRRGITTSFSQ